MRVYKAIIRVSDVHVAKPHKQNNVSKRAILCSTEVCVSSPLKVGAYLYVPYIIPEAENPVSQILYSFCHIKFNLA